MLQPPSASHCAVTMLKYGYLIQTTACNSTHYVNVKMTTTQCHSTSYGNLKVTTT